MKKTLTNSELVFALHFFDLSVPRELLTQLVDYLEQYETEFKVELEIDEKRIWNNYEYYEDKEDFISVDPDNEILFEDKGKLLVFYTDYFINQ